MRQVAPTTLTEEYLTLRSSAQTFSAKGRRDRSTRQADVVVDSERPRTRLLGFVLIILALALTWAGGRALLAGYSEAVPSDLWPTASLIFGLTTWCAVTKFRQGPVFAPYSVTMLLLVSIFAVRPLFMLRDGGFAFYGLGVANGFNTAAFAGFVALASMSIGYAVTTERRFRPLTGRSSPSSSEGTASDRSLHKASLVAVAFVVAWTMAMAVKGGGFDFVSELFAGRTQSIRQALSGLPAAVGAMPVAGAIVLSAVRVTVERKRSLLPSETVAFWVVIVLTTIPSLAQGTRRYLLPCLLVAALAAAAPKAKRRISGRMALLGLGAFFFLAIVPFVRSAGSRSRGAGFSDAVSSYVNDQGVLGTIRPFFVSYDTEMFGYVSTMVPRLGESVPYGYGRGIIGDLVLNPFPSALMPTELWSDKLLLRVLGTTCAQDYCPVPSAVGVLLFDFGLLGVLVGFFVLGLASRRFPGALERATDSRLVVLLSVGAFVPVLTRGNTVNIAYIMLSTLVMAALGMLLTKRSSAGNRDRLQRVRAANVPAQSSLRDSQTAGPRGASGSR